MKVTVLTNNLAIFTNSDKKIASNQEKISFYRVIRHSKKGEFFFSVKTMCAKCASFASNSFSIPNPKDARIYLNLKKIENLNSILVPNIWHGVWSEKFKLKVIF